MTKVVYLSGPIKDVTEGESKEWRFDATAMLSGHGFKVRDPNRRNFRKDEYLSSSLEIVSLDKMDIRSSDIILVNYSIPSVGTSMEINYAYLLGKPIVVFSDKKDEEISPWIHVHSTRVVHSMKDAINYIKNQFGGE